MSGIRLSRELGEQGFNGGEVERLVRSGTLERVRRGAYADPLIGDHVAAHGRLVDATLAQCSPEAVVSHVSAAVLHGLPAPKAHLGRVHLTRDRAGGGRTRRWVQVHGHPLDDEDVALVGGVRTTSLARTVVDLACTLPPRAAVPAGDGALRAGLERPDLERVLTRAGTRSGIAAARRTVGFLDARSESAGESFSRVVLAEHGVPTPEPQLVVTGLDGEFVGRCDFGWPALRTLGEFDGRVKYGRDLDPGRRPEDVLFEEKLREDRLRDLGWQLVRWIWADLLDPTDLLARLERAFDRGRRWLAT